MSDPMSLRTRLIIAFLLLSVVPLSAVTFFSYTSAASAFERAARREATDSAVDISRRMELITADVGRRMDQLFEEGPALHAAADPAAADMRERVAPLLGDAAAFVDRLEFHPMPEASGTHGTTAPNPTGAAPEVPAVPPVPPPPPAAPVIVVDVPKVMQEARRAARDGVAQTMPELGPLVEQSLTAALPAAEAGMAALGEALAKREESMQAAMQDLQMKVEGRRVEISVRKGGKVVGKANATLNLQRTMKTVLAFARREQGEIAFAIDRTGTVYAPDPQQQDTLRSLDISGVGPRSAAAGPRRVGDWVVVARKDPSGLILGIARPIGESLRELRRASLRNLSLGLLVIGLALVGIVPISHGMTRHVRSLTAGVRQLAAGDFRARVPVRTRDEFGTLATAFNQMAQDLERHQAQAVEQERLRRELELSRRIQTEMLPRAPLRTGPAEIKGISIPAREVGGDFFNYFVLPDGRLALLVGDVSGKGVSAALLMANVQATLRARVPLETDLAQLASQLDREIDESTPGGVYLTLFIGILDTARAELRYVNAGHNPQFVIRKSGGIEPMTSTGLPIALYSGHEYREASLAIVPGDLLFFYTDGLVEAENEAGEMFGAERLQQIIATVQSDGLDVVIGRIEQAVRAFRGRAEPLDDATLMALRLDPAGAATAQV
jgi:serine phosphatase RsbU (regulator of sigma subunit)